MEQTKDLDRFHEALSRHAPALGLSLDAPLRQRVGSWYGELRRWSAAMNLSRRVEPRAAAVELVLDSLVALPLLGTEGRLVDLGSGAGLPGLILAAAQPERPVTLVEPQAKRAAFLAHAARVMGLAAVEVAAARWPEWELPGDTRWVLSRAVFSDVAALSGLSDRLPAGAGCVLWRGEDPGDPPAGLTAQATPVQLPGLSRIRHLVVCTRKG